MIAENIKRVFIAKYNSVPLIVRSPGRINLIGEHTDYNDGYVMPAAINKGVYYAIAPNKTDIVNFYALDFDDFTMKVT